MTDCGCWGLVMSDSGCFWLFVADWLFVTVFGCFLSVIGFFCVFWEYIWVFFGVYGCVYGCLGGVFWSSLVFFRCFRGVFWVLGFSWCYGVYLGIFG